MARLQRRRIAASCFLWLLLLLVVPAASGLAPLRGLVRRIVVRPPPPTTTGYVPDGLTREEYASIKQEEAALESSRNYGAWGPRFAASNEPPPGDWFVMPQLWTKGAVEFPTSSAKDTISRRRGVAAFVLSLGAVHTLAWTVAALVWRRHTVPKLLQCMNASWKLSICWLAGSVAVSWGLTRWTQHYILETANRK